MKQGRGAGPIPFQPPIPDPLLDRILRQCGMYYHSGALFYQELWRQRLVNIGFRVTSVKKLPYHHVWDVRLYGNLTVQLYLLSLPGSVKLAWSGNVLPKLIAREIQRIAKELGPPIKGDCVSVVRSGAYFRVAFIWPLGKPGSCLKQEKPAGAFAFLIRPWVRWCRN